MQMFFLECEADERALYEQGCPVVTFWSAWWDEDDCIEVQGFETPPRALMSEVKP